MKRCVELLDQGEIIRRSHQLPLVAPGCMMIRERFSRTPYQDLIRSQASLPSSIGSYFRLLLMQARLRRLRERTRRPA